MSARWVTRVAASEAKSLATAISAVWRAPVSWTGAAWPAAGEQAGGVDLEGHVRDHELDERLEVRQGPLARWPERRGVSRLT